MPNIVLDSEHAGVRDEIARLLSGSTSSTGHVFAPVGLTLKLEESGQIIGGISGTTNWNWLYIELLAVDPKYQGQGYARKLVSKAEEIARERGCYGSWVDTFTFQAPEFYLKLGYEQFGALAHYPDSHSRIFLRKIFRDEGA